MALRDGSTVQGAAGPGRGCADRAVLLRAPAAGIDRAGLGTILLGHPRYAFPDDAARALGRAADHGSRHAARWRWPGSSWWVRVRNRGTEATGSITTTR